MRTLISLGNACEVAFQLRMHGGDNQSHFFDWMLADDPGSILSILRRDFDVFYPQDLAMVANRLGRERVADTSTGVFIPHAFPMEGTSVRADWRDHVAKYRDKMAFLAGRFRRILGGGTPVALVRRGITREQAMELEDHVIGWFPGSDVCFLYVTDKPDGDFATPLGHTRFIPQDGATGDAQAWARVLTEEGLVDGTFRLTLAEIMQGDTDFHRGVKSDSARPPVRPGA